MIDKLFLDMKKYFINSGLKLDIKKYSQNLKLEDFSRQPKK